MDLNFTIYGKENCGYCKRALAWMEKHDHSYEYISLDNQAALTEFKQANPTARTVPQIFVEKDGDVKHIGGYTDLVAEYGS